jgi:hypothetical protein
MSASTTEPPDRQSDGPEPDYLFEFVGGRIVEKLTSVDALGLAGLISRPICNHIASHPIGRVVNQMIFDLRPEVDCERRPDVAFVSFGRWARNRGLPRSRSWAVIPDLAIRGHRSDQLGRADRQEARGILPRRRASGLGHLSGPGQGLRIHVDDLRPNPDPGRRARWRRSLAWLPPAAPRAFRRGRRARLIPHRCTWVLQFPASDVSLVRAGSGSGPGGSEQH